MITFDIRNPQVCPDPCLRWHFTSAISRNDVAPYTVARRVGAIRDGRSVVTVRGLQDGIEGSAAEGTNLIRRER